MERFVTYYCETVEIPYDASLVPLTAALYKEVGTQEVSDSKVVGGGGGGEWCLSVLSKSPLFLPSSSSTTTTTCPYRMVVVLWAASIT